MNLTAVLDHTALAALFRADPFFTGLYIEASRGTGRVIIPSLSMLAAEQQVAGAGEHAASLRFAENVPFTAAHAADAMHAAAIAWQSVKAGEPVTVLSLEPELYDDLRLISRVQLSLVLEPPGPGHGRHSPHHSAETQGLLPICSQRSSARSTCQHFPSFTVMYLRHFPGATGPATG
ncbi:hypothetical protein AB0L85_31415 [Streptomyces sp. NPDC052051]|uniref:hypothetical protein n=1 Tax=Streptomyces sp. NPDC052051 TaxID=3154649 RepID=UPI00342CD2A3